MAAGRLIIPGWSPAVDADGVPIPNARVFFYLNKTTTLAAVFSDEAMTVPLVNPVPSNASGRFPSVWADDSVLYSASVDAPYGPAGIPFTYDNLSASMAADILVVEVAEAAAAAAQEALDEVNAAIDAATQAGGGDAALAGALAAQAVVADKADTDGGNITSPQAIAFRSSIGLGDSATQNVGTTNTTVARGDVPFTQSGSGTQTRSIYVKEQEFLSAADFVGFDATGVTASTSAIQAAINNAQATGRKLALPSGFKLDGPINITAPLTIAGDKRAYVTVTGGTFNTFNIQSSEVFISNLFIDSTGKSGGWDFIIDTGSGLTREQITIDNVFTLKSKGMMTDAGTGFTSIVKLRNFYGRNLMGQHTKFQRSFAYLDMEDCTADYNGSGAVVSAPAFEMIGTGLPTGSGGGVFKTCHVLGDAVNGNPLQALWRFKDYRGAWFDDSCTADSGPGIGYDFEGCIKLRGEIESSLNNGVGVRFTGCIGVDMRINGQGRNGIPGAASGVPMVQFNGAGNETINLSIGNLVDATGNLIETTGSQAGAINLHGGIASGAGGRAIKTLGASSVQWTGATIGSNAGGSYDFSSDLNTIEGVFPSGARTTVTGPGVG